MEKRYIGGTDLEVSVVCYGPMRLAQTRQDPKLDLHKRAMHVAIDRGINFIHSSYEYGVRWMMHDVLKSHPAKHDLLHVIKAPVPDWDDNGFDADKLEQIVDDALRDLCTNRIALVQWMWRCRPHDEQHRLPILNDIHDEVAHAFETLRAKGKVGHQACFPYFPESASRAMAHPSEEALIVYYNPLEMEMSPVIDTLSDNRRSFLAIRPLYEGVLTDQFCSHADVPSDHRLSKEKYADAFKTREQLVKAIPQAAKGMTRFAIRFPLMSANCSSVIVGLNSEEQVLEICDYVEDITPDPVTVARVRELAGY
ncbi:MAG: aldo/keto reductase [Granulosicoccus sp.]